MELTFRRPLNDEGVQRFEAERSDDDSVDEQVNQETNGCELMFTKGWTLWEFVFKDGHVWQMDFHF